MCILNQVIWDCSRLEVRVRCSNLVGFSQCISQLPLSDNVQNIVFIHEKNQ